MRTCLSGFALLTALAGRVAAWAEEDIVDVLRRSQDMRLAATLPAEANGPKASAIRTSFERVLRAMAPERACELRVVRGPLLAETLHGHLIVVNESLADMPEGVRLFVLAHELGHVQQQHWLAMAQVYQKWIPGPVKPEFTDPVARPLGREASRLAHSQEFSADSYAAQALHKLGRPEGDFAAVFQQLGSTQENATHPSSSQRLASLRAQTAQP